MGSYTIILLPPNAQRWCDLYCLPINLPFPPDNSCVPSPPDHRWIYPPEIQWPTFIPLSPLPISSTKPSPPSIILIRRLIFHPHPTHPLAMQSTSLDRSMCPKEEGDRLTSTSRSCSSTTIFNKQYGQREKGKSRIMQLHLAVTKLY